MPDLSLLLACTQCSNVSQTPANHCQEIRAEETTPPPSNTSACVSQPESMEVAFSPPIQENNQQTSVAQTQTEKFVNPTNKYNHLNQIAEVRPLQIDLLLPMGGFFFMLIVGSILIIWKRFPDAQRQWQLLLQGDTGIFSSDVPWQEKKKEFDQPVILKQSRAWSHAIVWSIVGVTSFAVVWSATAKIDESVPVQGKLEPKGFVKEIQAPVGGVIDQIHVQEGQRVKKGDLLVSFDRTASKAKLASLQAVRASLLAENKYYQTQMRSLTANASWQDLQEVPELAALTENRAALVKENQLFRAELNQGLGVRDLNPQMRQRLLTRQLEKETRIDSVRLDREQLTRQLNQAQVQLINARSTLSTNLEIANNLESLVDKGAFARLPYLEKQQAAEASRAEVNRLEQEVERLKLAIAQGQRKLENAIALSQEDLLSKIADNEKRIADIDSQLTKVIVENNKKIQELNSEIRELEVNMKYQELRAANDGIVFDLKPRSSGYVYNSSESILKIVPPENLVAQVFITNNDIGFIKPGMPVDVRIDSFPYTEFSDIKGQLVRVGSDALPPDQTHPYYRFAAEIRLDKQSININGTEVPLQSGMSLSANVNIRKRTVMSIFTDKFLGKVESLKYTR
ncbi:MULTISPECIES: HlyD family efflux transporter periplasmic adaptor subunit [unclassified Tolypothrix]|uniref:HlyD family efflux transporter periplasmic adaptor subunit n=1 Tax=unclassified Tolypothrix TaxID=2649714 RepID=UPI0005F7DD9C|nr:MULTISPECIES: HlyD family efflux transporter periplasmic adaptor subunit [unclassified Tolypothrix]MBE9083279.1 HlyD family efflux transporter periplasmic adaptor subunit [Tolypothrix sp. LEGE 11397]UYD24416.1 HlyD family efflux transporter periplasmic adaptor subunit [Tolypothrix sp. PCC 7712]UYD33350.1 HlyD family efflux transporter periplasmic adaptor subunit [Tolypothrix sp. PCC 7601]BAY90221.1 HlyD family secretion protein [Microchaete diplosiphon NIES-3275]